MLDERTTHKCAKHGVSETQTGKLLHLIHPELSPAVLVFHTVIRLSVQSGLSQSTGPWKISLTWPCSPVSHVPQNGQAAWKACVPCGSGIWLHPCTVFSEHTWPQGQKAWVGGPASRYRPPSQPSHRGT